MSEGKVRGGFVEKTNGCIIFQNEFWRTLSSPVFWLEKQDGRESERVLGTKDEVPRPLEGSHRKSTRRSDVTGKNPNGHRLPVG